MAPGGVSTAGADSGGPGGEDREIPQLPSTPGESVAILRVARQGPSRAGGLGDRLAEASNCPLHAGSNPGAASNFLARSPDRGQDRG